MTNGNDTRPSAAFGTSRLGATPGRGGPYDVGGVAGVIAARLRTLIEGERQFMVERQVTLPAARTAPAIADSDASDDE